MTSKSSWFAPRRWAAGFTSCGTSAGSRCRRRLVCAPAREEGRYESESILRHSLYNRLRGFGFLVRLRFEVEFFNPPTPTSTSGHYQLCVLCERAGSSQYRERRTREFLCPRRDGFH